MRTLARPADEKDPQYLHPRAFDSFRDASDLLRVEALVERSEEHTSELQSLAYLVCRLLLEKKKTKTTNLSPYSYYIFLHLPPYYQSFAIYSYTLSPSHPTHPSIRTPLLISSFFLSSPSVTV